MLLNKLDNLPKLPGVYIMRDLSGRIIYVGKSSSLKSRVRSYFIDTAKSLKNSLLVKTIKNIDYILTTNIKEALVLEESLIKRFQPKYNVIWKDDKRYPYIKITDDKFPFLDIVRTKKHNGGTYFGPYPDASNMKKTLKLVQKIFGLRPCRYNLEKRKKECLYYFIKKCQAPCIGKISEKKYSYFIGNAIMFLSGKNQKLLKSLEKEMTAAKKKLQYEEAAKLRNIIFTIKNTLEKINIKEITLKDILINADRDAYLNDLSKLIGKKTVGRIEGFDISNILGKLAVGSMVVFENGIPKKSDYRKFKIKTVSDINDCEMIGEIIKRRYTGTIAEKTPLPDLIIIDGGKGQLRFALNELEKCFDNEKIPKIISIAKCSPRLQSGVSEANKEKLFFPKNPEPVILPKNSLALNLIKYVRDEAHRFAISYHKLLRKKLLKE
ncbi:MAG: excinuclease ABC subunit UvrC [Elusimicrobia bacterium]|nr:excinuclease ABC subunit UvrC [Elusimicrobiota bacterium]